MPAFATKTTVALALIAVLAIGLNATLSDTGPGTQGPMQSPPANDIVPGEAGQVSLPSIRPAGKDNTLDTSHGVERGTQRTESPSAPDGVRASDLPESQELRTAMLRLFPFAPETASLLKERTAGQVIGLSRTSSLPVEVQRDVQSMLNGFAAQLDGLSDEIVELTREAFLDYYGNGRYPCYVRQEEMRTRTREGSHFFTDAVTQEAGYYCDVGFRSADYPALNDRLEAAAEIRIERQRQFDQYLAINGITRDD